MTKRETRVINAFCNCVKNGEFSEDYAITLIEDTQRYGWMTDEAKEVFYDFLDSLHPEPAEEMPEPDPEEEQPEEPEDVTTDPPEEPAEESSEEEPEEEEPQEEEPTEGE